jgi:nucleobase:cation symporter-1, NCS1 family
VVTLVALTVGEADEAFANAYSAAVSLQNLLPQIPLRLLVTLTTGIGTLGALVIDLVSYQTFLLLLGSVFVPLFAVLLADWLLAGGVYTDEDVFAAPAWRPGLIAAWVVGFGVYQWLYPTGPEWWVDALDGVAAPDWGLGATVPSFAAAFAIALAVAAVERRSWPTARASG